MASKIYFYPRSPRGERRHSSIFFAVTTTISIHAPREGSDYIEQGRIDTPGLFLSTLPARGATALCHVLSISGVFLSTLPARGATVLRRVAFCVGIISIHAPREGSDGCP